MGLFILLGIFGLVSMLVSSQLKRKFKQYSQMRLSSNLSGAEIAQKMLSDNGISDVQVISVAGQLTDHYNPAKKTVNLSEVVYHERNIAAAAVAAHEVGHAIQHAKAYKWLGMRSKLVPVVNISSKVMNVVMIAGFAGALGMGLNIQIVGMIIIAAQAMLAAFALVTLPVEYDASNRALAWMQTAGVANPAEMEQGKDALKWAARTYLVAALAAVANLLYFIIRFTGRN